MHELGHFNKDCLLPSANSLLFFAENVKKKTVSNSFPASFSQVFSRFFFFFVVCLFVCLFFFVLNANMVLKSEFAAPARHDVF